MHDSEHQYRMAEETLVDDEYNFTEEIRNDSSKSWLPKRYVIIILLFFGLANVFLMRVNLNIALVEMTSNKTIVVDNRTIAQKPEFDWNSKTKGIVLSLFFYGYLFIMPLGGYFASKFGGVSTFGIGVFVTAIFTFLTPINLYLNFYWFAVCRIIEGMAEALSYTSTSDICARWTKPEERSKMVSLAFTGVHIGVAVGFPLCGYIARVYGWPAIFYVTGGLSLIWFCFWIMLATNDPAPNDDDRKFLRRIWNPNRSQPRIFANYPDQKPYPWKNLLTSRPVWILFLGKVSYGWGYNLMVQCFPMYIKDATGASIDNVGYLSAIPNIAGMLTVPLSGYMIDFIINRSILTPTYAHKLTMCSSLLISGSLLIATSYINNFKIIFIVFIFFKMAISVIFVTEQVVPLYLSPEYASGICGLTAFGYTLSNIISPTIFGFMVTDNSIIQWNRFFTMSAALSLAVTIIFGLFSSSELQPWSDNAKSREFQRIDQ